MMEGVERYGIYALIGGLVLLVVGYVWLLRRAFKLKLRWRGAMIGLPPLAPFYALAHARRMAGPLMMMTLGGLMLGAPI